MTPSVIFSWYDPRKMRADRLLSILLLLQVHRQMTARELAQRLEVSERTVHRDMEALAMTGVPVYAERGPRGGWVLPHEFRTKLPGMTGPGIRAIFLSRSAVLLSDLDLMKAADAAFIKLLAALPASDRLDAQYARERIHVDGAGWHQGNESVQFLQLLQEAVWAERRVDLCYERADNTVVDRVVNPLGLVAKRNTWYLVAAVEDGIRTFRVSRARAATVCEERFVRPAEFDLAAYWQQSSREFVANLPRYPATVRVAPDAVARARGAGWLVHVESEEPNGADGWLQLSLRFDVIEEACRYILGFGPDMEVIEPAELRDRVTQMAGETLALYRGNG